MKIDSIIKAELNIDILQAVILSFLSGFNGNCSYDLLLIATAFVYSKPCRESLSNANNKSTMQSIFLKQKVFDDTKSLVLWANVSQRVEILKQNFNLALIDLNSKEQIEFDKTIKINSVFDYKIYTDNIIKSYLRAAYYLGIMMKKCDSNDIINSVLRRI